MTPSPPGPSSTKKRALKAKRERQKRQDHLDRENLAAWQAGDKKAGERLFAHYCDRLYDFFDRRISRDIADLVQDTLAVCITNPNGFAGKSRFEVYLFGIANNKLREHFREHAKDPQRFATAAAAGQVIDPSPTLPSLLGTGQDQVLLAALRGLDWKHQVAFELYVWEGFSGPELSEALGLSINTVYSRIRRAKELLKEQLETYEQDPVQLRTTKTKLSQWLDDIGEQALEKYPKLAKLVDEREDN